MSLRGVYKFIPQKSLGQIDLDLSNKRKLKKTRTMGDVGDFGDAFGESAKMNVED